MQSEAMAQLMDCFLDGPRPEDRIVLGVEAAERDESGSTGRVRQAEDKIEIRNVYIRAGHR